MTLGSREGTRRGRRGLRSSPGSPAGQRDAATTVLVAKIGPALHVLGEEPVQAAPVCTPPDFPVVSAYSIDPSSTTVTVAMPERGCQSKLLSIGASPSLKTAWSRNTNHE